MKTRFVALAFALTVGFASLDVAANSSTPAVAPKITGDYLEVRSCDVFTGSCFANAEMGLAGREAILVWSVREGSWKGTSLAGLGVIAVVRTDATLGDLRYQPRTGKAVLIVDERASAIQKEALVDMARELSGLLTKSVVDVKSSALDISIGNCSKAGCAKVQAGNLVQISTRCLGGGDHVCGNEDLFYPPMTKVEQALPAFSEIAAYRGDGLGLTWEGAGQRNVYLAKFSK